MFVLDVLSAVHGIHCTNNTQTNIVLPRIPIQDQVPIQHVVVPNKRNPALIQAFLVKFIAYLWTAPSTSNDTQFITKSGKLQAVSCPVRDSPASTARIRIILVIDT